MICMSCTLKLYHNRFENAMKERRRKIAVGAMLKVSNARNKFKQKIGRSGLVDSNGSDVQ